MKLKSSCMYTEFIMSRKEFLNAFYLKDDIKLSSEEDYYSVVKTDDDASSPFIFYVMKEKNPNPEGDSFIAYEKETDEIRVGYNIMMCYLVSLAKYMVEKDGFKLED